MPLRPSKPLLNFAAAVVAMKAALVFLIVFDWEHGVLRGSVLVGGLAALVAVMIWSRPRYTEPQDAAWVAGAAKWLAVSAIASLSMGAASIATTYRLGDGYFDQSQNIDRSAQYLLRGENPYSAGMLLDPSAYFQRAPMRNAAGIAPTIDEAEIRTKANEFWRTLDPTLRRQLLPTPQNADPVAAREYAVLGYKYGPIPLIAVTALVPALGAVAVPLLNLLCTIIWAAALGAIVLRIGWSAHWAWIAVGLALLDPHVAFIILFLNALDIWPMMFGALGVLALVTRRPILLGAMLALAFGSKIFPAAIYLPLLLMLRPTRSIASFIAITAAIHLPWLLWDATGFFNNVLLWPTLMLPDDTSWVFYASTGVALTIRLALLAAVAAVSLWLILRGGTRRTVWSLAFLNLAVVCAGSTIHNNYLPWFSAWYALALMYCLIEPDTDNGAPRDASA